ncbi:Protein F59C6.8 [Aphelenchoides avenae]|nr:Protein F59C6.8 [Aphelenchus avenae]
MLEFGLIQPTLGERMATVTYRQAVEGRLGVVSCFSPLFYAERWQIVVLALELYRQFGVDMQVYYIQSALEEIRNLLEVYERLGHLRIEPWTLIELAKSGQRTLGYDPNTEMEWRNQASAHTDCLLNYKAAADFIIIGDIDDFLFPKLGNTYAQEFQRLHRLFPEGAGFTYARYNADFTAGWELHAWSGQSGV